MKSMIEKTCGTCRFFAASKFYTPCFGCGNRRNWKAPPKWAAEVERLEAQVHTLQTEYVLQNPCTDPQDEIDELTRNNEWLEKELSELRKRCGEWADDLEWFGKPSVVVEGMREEAKKV